MSLGLEELANSVATLLTALMDYRERGREPSLSLSFTAEQLMATSEEVCELRGWVEAPIDRAFKNALAELLALIGKHMRHGDLNDMLKQIARADTALADYRYSVLKKCCDGLITGDGARWIS